MDGNLNCLGLGVLDDDDDPLGTRYGLNNGLAMREMVQIHSLSTHRTSGFEIRPLPVLKCESDGRSPF